MITEVCLLVLFVLLYLLSTRNFDYWSKKNVIYQKPYPFVGNLWQLLTLRTSIAQFLKDIYLQYPNESYVGIFLGNQPCLVVRDPVVGKDILGKNCDHFAKNILAPHPDIEPILARSLFPLHGPEWKLLRTKLSPAFNTKKLGNVYPEILKVAEQYQKKIALDGVISGKDIVASYTVDVIANAVLGMETRALYQKDDRLRRVSRELAGEDVMTALRNNLAFSIPEILHFFKLGLFLESSFQIMREVVWESVQMRIKGYLQRDDFLNHLLQLKDKGDWTLPDGSKIVLEGDYFVGQVFMFMAAGFSTTTSSLLYTLYEVSKSQRVQNELRREIEESFPDGAAIDYHILREMKYLNCVIAEGLRMHPGFPFIDRICTQDYKVPDSNFVIEKGTNIFVPMMGYHYDPELWPQPDLFIPERHLVTELSTKAYIPFGFGPKSCLGQRFAVLEMKALLVCLVRSHSLHLAKTTPRQLTPNPRRFHDFSIEDVHIEVRNIIETTNDY